jgi:AraC-like DNA-binding protein
MAAGAEGAVHPIPLVRARTLQPLLDFVRRGGGEAPSSLARVEPILRDPCSLIPLAHYGRLWADAARESGDDALGLRVGEQSRIEDVGELGGLVRSAQSVGEALETAERLVSRFNSGHRFTVIRRGEEIWVRGSFVPAMQHGRQEVNDFTLMWVVHTIRLGAGASWRPSEIHLEGRAPRHAEQIAALAETSVRFGESSTTLVFPRRVLALAIPSAPSSPTFVSRGTTLPAHDFERSVRQTIASLLQLGGASLPIAAEMSGTSVRSLQRRLHASQLDFGSLVEEARLESARRMLGNPHRKIVEVAAELGYTDSANFTRAFRRWTGVPPREFRRAHAAP